MQSRLSPLVTIWSKTANGKPVGLSKVLSRAPDGSLQKAGGAGMLWEGTGLTVAVESDAAFAALLAGLRSDQAISLGVMRTCLTGDGFDGTAFKLTTTSKGEADGLTRTRSNMIRPVGRPGYVMLDVDLGKAPPEVRDRIKAETAWGAITSAIPSLQGVAAITRPSVACRVLDQSTGEVLEGSSGTHIYLRVADGADGKRLVETVHARLIIAGLGWAEIALNGRVLVKSAVDTGPVWPESLCYEGQAELVPPLVQPEEWREPVLHAGRILDSRDLPPLTTDENRQRIAIETALRKAVQAEAERVAAEYDVGKVEEAVTVARRRDPSLSERAVALIRAEAVEARRMIREGGQQLPGATVLHFDDGTSCAVNDLFRRIGAKEWKSMKMADPLEPEYGGSDGRPGKNKAMLYRKDGKFRIVSFAHGGQHFDIAPDVGAVRRAADELEALPPGKRLGAYLRLGGWLGRRWQVWPATDTEMDRIDALCASATVALRGKLGKQVAPVSDGDDGFDAYLARYCDAEGVEPDDIDAMLMEVLRADWSGQEPDWMRAAVEDMELERAEAEELERARLEYKAREGNDPDRHRWMLTMPSRWTQELANALHHNMAMDMPGAAAMGALLCTSIIAANRFFVRDEYDTPLHMFGAMAGRTGAGKDALIGAMVQAAELSNSESARRLTSGPALHEALLESPNFVLAMDEWGKAVAAQNKDKSGNGDTLAAVVLELYGHGLKFLDSHRYARGRKVKVAFPYLVTFGVCTGAELVKVLTKDKITDGTLNRNIILDGENGVGGRWPVGHVRPPLDGPLQELVNSLGVQEVINQPARRKAMFYQRVRGAEGFENKQHAAIIVRLGKTHDQRLRTELERLEAELGPLAELAARFVQNSIIVAGLLRIGDFTAVLDDPETDFVVTDAQLAWAMRFTAQCIMELAQKFGRRVAESESDGVLIEARDRLIAVLDPVNRDSYTRKYDRALDNKVIPIALLDRMLGSARSTDIKAHVQRMIDRDWIEEMTEPEIAAFYRGKSGKRAKRAFRVRSGLYY